MTNIATLEERVGLPLQLCDGGSRASLPAEVVAYISAAKPWHLIAWHEGNTGAVGFAYKGGVAVLDRSKLEHLSVEFIRPAKGRGWVVLEAKLSNQAVPTPLLQCRHFNEEAVAWLLQRREQLERLFGHKMQVNDHGFDY